MRSSPVALSCSPLIRCYRIRAVLLAMKESTKRFSISHVLADEAQDIVMSELLRQSSPLSFTRVD